MLFLPGGITIVCAKLFARASFGMLRRRILLKGTKPLLKAHLSIYILRRRCSTEILSGWFIMN